MLSSRSQKARTIHQPMHRHRGDAIRGRARMVRRLPAKQVLVPKPIQAKKPARSVAVAALVVQMAAALAAKGAASADFVHSRAAPALKEKCPVVECPAAECDPVAECVLAAAMVVQE